MEFVVCVSLLESVIFLVVIVCSGIRLRWYIMPRSQVEVTVRPLLWLLITTFEPTRHIVEEGFTRTALELESEVRPLNGFILQSRCSTEIRVFQSCA